MATFRVFKESGNFVTVNKEFIHNDNLSWKAKGILLYLLSRPDDWQVYETELQKHAADGKDSLKSGIKELEEIGYIKRDRKRDDKGHFREYDYQVFEYPTQSGLSNVGKSNVGKSDVGKPATTNNNSTNNDCTNNDGTILSGNPTVPYQQVVDYLNEKTGKQYKHTTKKTQSLIKARTKEGFNLDDFKQVIDNMSSQWMNDSKMNQYLRPETLFGTKFEGYLNQQQSNAADEDWKKQYEDVF